jgi:hypothetical protein
VSCVSGMVRHETRTQRTSLAMSSRPVNCRHVSLSMMFCTSGSTLERGSYKHLFCRPSQFLAVWNSSRGTHEVLDGRHRSNRERTRVADACARTEEGTKGKRKSGHFSLFDS